MDGVPHAVAGGGGRLKLGTVSDARLNAVDIYNTCLRAYGIDQVMGDPACFNEELTSLLR